MPGNCKFNIQWLSYDKYKQWLVQGRDLRHAMCRVCESQIDISSMGESALTCHSKGKKHQRQLESFLTMQRTNMTVSSFFKPSTSAAKPQSSRPSAATASLSGSGPSTSATAAGTASASSTGTNQSNPLSVHSDARKAEILWILRQVVTHQSFRSSSDSGILFRKMFPDSKIAEHFSCGEQKCRYIAIYGLAPYFKNLLTSRVKDEDAYVVLFDESLNSKTHTKQMDIHVRIWTGDRVVTRFFTAEFMGHGTAEIMLEKFIEGMGSLKLSDILQVSMDGPNVNWKFHRLLQAEIKKNYANTLLNVGSCGLHVVHGALKRCVSATGWTVENFLQSLYWLFKDTPARRDDYKKIIGKSDPLMPLEYCKTRWTENAPVAERALEIFEDVKKYTIKETNVTTQSFKTVKECCNDPLMPAKLCFIISVANEVRPFLTVYQTDRPMLPFLATDLFTMIKSLMKRFIKEDTVKTITSVQKLSTFDIKDKNILSHVKKVEIGFRAEKRMEEAKNISERRILEFRLSCREGLLAIVTKLLEKTPIKYSLARCVTCLDPKKMVNTDSCISKMKVILRLLMEANRVQEADCEPILGQFREFLDNETKGSSFKEFDYKSDQCRVDTLLNDTMNNISYSKLWNVSKQLLLLSHGQATVERGFSVNRQTEVENLKENSFAALRMIIDHSNSVGGYMNIDVSKAMLLAATAARSEYSKHLEEQKKAISRQKLVEKRKADLDELDGLKQKKRCLETDISALVKSADSYALKAEASRNLTFIVKSNSLRKSSKDKTIELAQVMKAIEEKQDNINNN